MSTPTSTLNSLIETLKDGEEGFRSAADSVKSPDLKSLFTQLSQQRAQAAGELQSLAKSLGESSPANTSSVAGAVHRGWINLKAAITKQDDHAILAECERGEDSAVAAYKSALEQELPVQVRSAVERQFAEVKIAHDKVRDLRDETAA